MGLSWRRWACRRGSPPCRRCPRRRWSLCAIDRAYWSWTSLLRQLPFTLPAIVAPRRVISKREAEAPPEPNASEPVLGHSHVIAKERAMPNRKNLEDLFSETLKDIYFAEKQ